MRIKNIKTECVMTTKRTYIAPEIHIIPLGLGNEVMQHFNVTSDTINEGDAKGGFFDEEEDDADEQGFVNYSPWED